MRGQVGQEKREKSGDNEVNARVASSYMLFTYVVYSQE